MVATDDVIQICLIVGRERLGRFAERVEELMANKKAGAPGLRLLHNRVARLLAVLGELRVEDDLRRREILGLHIGAGLGGTVFAVHAAVFPFNAERTAVVDVVQRADDLLEVDVPTAHGLEVPVALGLVEIDVTTEHAGVVTEIPGDVLHVDVEDAVFEFIDELHIIDALVAEVRGVVVEAEGWMIIDSFQRTTSGADVIRVIAEDMLIPRLKKLR